ncbi:MAG: hypothetical protein HC893_07550 [Chloroflexaceae bacterium]|nr:hypothetical protein [Chloroflexaceae bacterium]NJL33727.1 hypothetical protein [Chloroflexaceae bacterium]
MSNTPYRDELILTLDDLPPRLRAWLEQAPAAMTVSLERLGEQKLVLRPMPDVDPLLLAHIRVTIAKYHEALMNLT